ncbi:hypothetical protein T484DRAFT_1757399 [Baffinella frigidus]|nr:hypothetical protein T484DRAFT_1757399 [Cryptophyta sp. CCMP2293]
MNINEIIQAVIFQAPSEEYNDVVLENNFIINANDITFKSYTNVDFETGNATYNEFKIVSEDNAIAFETVNNNLILYKLNNGTHALRCVDNDIKIVDNGGDEVSLRQVSLDIEKLQHDATIAQILDGILTLSGWAGSAGMDAVMLSMMAKMKAQFASLFTISAVNPFEQFTDIVDGIEDIEDPADIAGKLEELEFTQTEVNKAIFRFIAHIKQAHNYKVNHKSLVYPLSLDEYDNLIFIQAVGKGQPPRFDDKEGISTLMYGKTGIDKNLYVAGDIFYNATFNKSDSETAHDYFTNKKSLTTSLNSKQDIITSSLPIKNL